MKIARALSVLFLGLICASVAQAGSRITPFLPSELQSTCGCSFQFRGGNQDTNTFLQWSEGENAFMYVDGRLENFSVDLAKTKSRKTGRVSLGDTSLYVLKNDKYTVNVQSTVVQVCRPKVSECEFVGLNSRITLISRLGTTTVNSSGVCGC